MKIERLLAILVILLQNKKVTATYLAQRFCVSKRTIYRDLTDLSLAGIPILTSTGNSGGIMIDEDYRLSKTLFTEQELQAIFSGLLGLDSVSNDQKYQEILQKLFLNKENHMQMNHMLINLSSHYKETLAPKIEGIQQAIEQCRMIHFHYCSPANERMVTLEPYLIVYEWSNWYVMGYDEDKCDFRMYKLNRLWDMKLLNRTFEIREIPEDKLNFDQFLTNEITAVIRFDPCVKYRIIEEYGVNSFAILENGDLLFTFPFTNKEYLLDWIMSFQDKAELMEPKELRVELKQRIEKTLYKYNDTDIQLS